MSTSNNGNVPRRDSLSRDRLPALHFAEITQGAPFPSRRQFSGAEFKHFAQECRPQRPSSLNPIQRRPTRPLHCHHFIFENLNNSILLGKRRKQNLELHQPLHISSGHSGAGLLAHYPIHRFGPPEPQSQKFPVNVPLRQQRYQFGSAPPLEIRQSNLIQIRPQLPIQNVLRPKPKASADSPRIGILLHGDLSRPTLNILQTQIRQSRRLARCPINSPPIFQTHRIKRNPFPPRRQFPPHGRAAHLSGPTFMTSLQDSSSPLLDAYHYRTGSYPANPVFEPSLAHRRGAERGRFALRWWRIAARLHSPLRLLECPGFGRGIGSNCGNLHGAGAGAGAALGAGVSRRALCSAAAGSAALFGAATA